ncbi:MAG TPA: RsmE family RNA methyltransferase [Candidatus Marinimicrobia bacterium]|nr:RsmE family RNA methyltransferase [Candidatus Neomarinimicrobiota bacterium]HRS52425.1 RsmE family RNA methyltransferase [Candidatus Neomarinimicrobiota bacterium]HRU92514.1 RsmE family RNA methyltransferase [Candidatus Neomarinimicrobiota bacterium]
MHAYQFYIPMDKILEGTFDLEGDEFRHCCRVLRKTSGDSIDVFAGNGRRWSARIEKISNNRAACRIIAEYPPQTRLKPEITLGIGLLKNNLMDDVVISATALGVARIVPLHTTHSIKNKVNLERLEKLSLAALKQSGLAYLPQISKCLTLDEWFNLTAEILLKLTAEQHASFNLNRLQNLPLVEQVAVMIGPEGGFEENEIEKAQQFGFDKINIFPYRLRTELAVVTALAGIRTLTLKNHEAYNGN